MQMMNVLKPIAFDVVICMSQLFDYYLFAVSISLICYVQYPTWSIVCIGYDAGIQVSVKHLLNANKIGVQQLSVCFFNVWWYFNWK